MSDYDNLRQCVSGLAHQLSALNRQAVSVYQPIVDELIRSDSRDSAAIERTLDDLLDFCGHDAALVLYRRLCRHYWRHNPEATVSCINAYRETWGLDDDECDSDRGQQSRERQGASRRCFQSDSTSQPPAASAELVSDKALAVGSSATPSTREFVGSPASPAASAVPLTEARP